MCIAKVIGIFYHRVASTPRLAFEWLELCDGKLSRSVLRGLGAGNSPRLPGVLKGMISIGYYSLIAGLGAVVVSRRYHKSLLTDIQDLALAGIIYSRLSFTDKPLVPHQNSINPS